MNACEDYLIVLLCIVLGIESVDEHPSSISHDLWTRDKHVRQKEMDIILSDIIDKFVDITFNDQHTHVSHTNETRSLSMPSNCLA